MNECYTKKLNVILRTYILASATNFCREIAIHPSNNIEQQYLWKNVVMFSYTALSPLSLSRFFLCFFVYRIVQHWIIYEFFCLIFSSSLRVVWYVDMCTAMGNEKTLLWAGRRIKTIKIAKQTLFWTPW